MASYGTAAPNLEPTFAAPRAKASQERTGFDSSFNHHAEHAYISGGQHQPSTAAAKGSFTASRRVLLGLATQEKLESSGMIGPVLLRSAAGAVGLQERFLPSLIGNNIDPGKNLEK